MGWLDAIFGKSTVTDDRPPAWPSADDVALSRKYNASYGQPAAAYVQPQPVPPGPSYGLPVPTAENPQYSGQVTTADTFPLLQRTYKMMSMGMPPILPPAHPMTNAMADDMTAAYLGARKSAVSTLGFDPANMVIGQQPEKDLTLGGAYTANPDQILTTGAYPSTMVHESFHRGIEKMRQAGVLPTMPTGEEPIVRAMMQRKLGMVEQGRGDAGDSGVQDGIFVNKQWPKELDAIEAAAAAYLAKQTPGGPR